MLLLNLTLPTPAENLALDEAILESAEGTEDYPEVIRFWESSETFVVLGRGSSFEKEVNHPFCEANEIPVLRRCSGGATVVAGPGCLMYAILLDYQKRPELRMLDVAHQFVMGKLMRAISELDVQIEMKGTCDLVHHGRKVSGNALRCKRRYMIYHGTFLTGMPIDHIVNCLKMPARQPDYRNQRSHQDFLGTLPLNSDEIRLSVASEWSANTSMKDWPNELTQELAQSKYATKGWTEKI